MRTGADSGRVFTIHLGLAGADPIGLRQMVSRIALGPLMAAESLQMLFALGLGFAVAGMCSSGYRVFTSRLPSFNQLSAGPGAAAFAAVPVLVISAPFLIMRNTIIGRRQEERRFEFVFLATLIAGFWSLMSGLVLVATLQACGVLLA